jgi:hypothetical protein
MTIPLAIKLSNQNSISHLEYFVRQPNRQRQKYYTLENLLPPIGSIDMERSTTDQWQTLLQIEARVQLLFEFCISDAHRVLPDRRA